MRHGAAPRISNGAASPAAPAQAAHSAVAEPIPAQAAHSAIAEPGPARAAPAGNPTTPGSSSAQRGSQTEPEPALAAEIEPFDSFWEAPEDVERGYASFYQFYRVNYLPHLPAERGVRILVISCGPGYFVDMLGRHGYRTVTGIDSDAVKVEHGHRRGLACRHARAFEFLAAHPEAFDVIVCEQELNHLTKQEMRVFLGRVRASLSPGGTLIVHGLNGANPITGAEALAQNIDHFNTFTDYSLRQVLSHAGFERIRVFPLHLYVFYRNPLNYVAWGLAATLELLFRAAFVLYGKSNRIFTKKIGAVCHKPGGAG